MKSRLHLVVAGLLALALLALLVAGGTLLLAGKVPGVARLLYGEQTAVPVAPRTTPPGGGAGEWIAFETQRGRLGDYEIYVMRPDGSQLTNLTGSWADDVAPAWAPDGRHIAFVSVRDSLSGKLDLEPGNLYLQEFDPVAGVPVGQAVRLTDFPSAEGWPAWSPDGERLAFHADIDGNFDIWALDVASALRGDARASLVNLTHDPADDKFPNWSPDGRHIAFASTRAGGEYDVYVMGADGSGPVDLTNNPARDRYPIWSPPLPGDPAGGARLTFNTDRDGTQEIYIMNRDGSGLLNVTRTPDDIEGLADWSPDGRRLVLYSEQHHDKDVYVVDLETGRWTNLTNSPDSSDEYCAWWP